MLIGCHVSIAGGIFNAPERAADFGCEVMQIFSRSPQGGKAIEITDSMAQKFKKEIKKHKIKEVYIHTPYYINFASAQNRIRYGSVSAVRKELEAGTLIGAKYVMTHLGSAKDLGEKESIIKTTEMLQKSLDNYSGKTKLLIENSAGAGQIIGDTFLEIAEIIKKVKNKNIAGICLDTQHSFASGYDWRNFNKTLAKIDKEIGLDKIKLFHVNDSMVECASHVDRHEHIGKGHIGLAPFEKILKFTQKNNIDLILETKHPEVKEDIKLLKEIRNNL